ncbi:MAG TPA: glutathione S-transferase [Stellaceae bacterium]|nr:glutathione S-transferase [Stellaceae bacterium]
MKLYEFALAPNPRRVRIFLAEKGVTIPTVQVNLREQEQLKPEFLAINPFATVPVLELDDGRRIAETIAICRYIEATHPEPRLFGRDAYEQAVTEEWQRHVELEGMAAVAEGFRNSTPGMKGRAVTGQYGYEQIAELAERGKARAMRFFELLDKRLANQEYIVGDRYSVADISALVAHDFGTRTKVLTLDHLPSLTRWHGAVSARPSAKA